jgi:hypothetical protein
MGLPLDTHTSKSSNIVSTLSKEREHCGVKSVIGMVRLKVEICPDYY